MGVSLALDKRYVVNEKILEKAKGMRDEGLSYAKIGKLLKVSEHTIYYWLNPEYRQHKRKINAKRVHPNNKQRQKDKVELYKKFREDYALGYIAKQVYVYQHLKKDVKILGVSMKKHWIPFLKKHYHLGGRKLGL